MDAYLVEQIATGDALWSHQHKKAHKWRAAMDGVGAAGSSGTQVTSNASANTKGASYTTISSSCPIDADGFYLSVLAGTASRDFLIDLALGASSSEVNIVNNLYVSSGTVANTEVGQCYIPLPVRAGQRLSARCQSGTGSSSIFIAVQFIASRFAPRLKRATTYGANTADSGGTVIDPGGVANTYPANYTQLSAGITGRVRYVLVCIGAANNFARSAGNHHFELGSGAAASEVVVASGMYAAQDAARDSFSPPWFERYLYLPAGTRLAAHMKSSNTDAGDRLADMVVIGFD